MNNDQNLIFEAYRNSILSEAPIGAEYEPFVAAAKQGVVGRAGDTYLFADLIKKTGKSADEVVELIVKPVYDALFPGGRFDADGDEKEQLNSLQAAIHSELVHLGYPKARAGYTARIIKNAVAPAIKFLSDKASSGEEIDETDVEDAITDAIEDSNDQSGQELRAAPAAHGKKSAKPAAASSVEGDLDEAQLKIYNFAGEPATRKELEDFARQEAVAALAQAGDESRESVDAATKQSKSDVAILINQGYLMETEPGSRMYTAADHNEAKEQKEGEGSGEVTSGISDDDLEDDSDAIRHYAGRGADDFGYKGSPFRFSND
jgi:hypothetical protein